MATSHSWPNVHRELYFHVQGGCDLSLKKASEDLTWQGCIEEIKVSHGQVCYLVQCGMRVSHYNNNYIVYVHQAIGVKMC